MLKGLRVVRGPDWKWNDQDGGRGCVGTVIPTPEKKSSNAVVCWDSGVKATYRVSDGSFDLRIYDNGPMGVKHSNVTCDCCGQDGILGIRWKCRQCGDYDLCHSCYHRDKHNLQHPFSRIDTENTTGVDVPCRAGATKWRALGLFPGAHAIRGPDWTWGDQDGGAGSVGKVTDFDSTDGSYRSWVKVTWPNGKKNVYRCGDAGKMELKYKEKETNGDFYKDHLPVFDGTKIRPYVNSGDKVRLVNMETSKLKELQLTRCGWDDDIIKVKGEVGEVIMVDHDGDVKVKFDDSTFFVNPLCLMLEKKSASAEGVSLHELGGLGDLMALMLKSQLSSALHGLMEGQSSPRGMSLFNAAVEGDVGKVREIINDNAAAVKFKNDKGQTPLMAAANKGHLDVVRALVQHNAPLDVKDNDGDTALTFAVIGDNPSIVEFLLDQGSNINTSDKKGVTPLHVATGRGYSSCAEKILTHKSGCNVNCKTEEGHTPLFFTIEKNESRNIQLLVQHPRVDLKMVDAKGFNSLHFAAIKNSRYAVERILQKAPGMLNMQKSDGFTALHLAALNDHPEIVLTLVKRVNCQKDLKNVSGNTALHLASAKCHNKCIEALVNNGANVNAKDSDGDTSLHIVMIKASMKDILGVTPMGKLMELINAAQSGGDANDEKLNLVAIAVYFIKNDADIYIKNNKGQNVLDVVVNPSIEKLLKETFQKKRAARPTSGKNVSCKVS
ncbi:E3 ubiquitin-protein ligase MIB1-like [Asterias rubens]|uniref:E3 ubiquitin-protein ligase MIB1-like n=1 Tax=Asterias rubens TaxID=7604 RepID=UPI001454EF92|nr:E3 ubiquitin-protein ligase MIB1-like [Asterias rubens]XP_033639201.1 E3 ubiquitin-protein ligase MIB1-like [Asterias rubens]